MLPRFIINYKAYSQAVGEKGVSISKAASRVSKELGVSIAVAPMLTDIRINASIVEVMSQHLDDVESGSHTGHITAEAVKDAGAKGVLLNHSERRIGMDKIEKASAIAKKFGLYVVSCAENAEEASLISKLGVDAVALEPRELIGSGRAVSKEKPEEIKRAVESVDKPLYVGAGITSYEDVKASLELGAYGILVASAIVKAENPEEKIREMAKAFVEEKG